LPGSIDAAIYHSHHSLHLEDIPFWLDLASKSPGPVLELGCGTGRVTIALAAAGYRVIGLDKDFSMLSFLGTNLPQTLSARVKFLQADFTNFNLAARFGLEIMPCNTFSTLSPTDRLKALAGIKHHLMPGGLFVASIPNPKMLLEIPDHGTAEVEEIISHPVTGDPVQVSSSWIRSQEEITFYWHYDHLFPDGRAKRFTVQTSHFLETVECIREEFRTAGLKITKQLGDYDSTPYRVDSRYWIVFAA
jgi:SAM-dependent methyltransferase